MAEQDVWRQRFLLFMGARLFGLTVFLLGVAVAFTDLLREGGWPLVGGILAVVGALDAVFAPRMLKKIWDDQDRAAGRHRADGGGER